jgi:hypothetical protein
MDVGIMHLVGESVANEGLTVIGIPSYKRIENFMKVQVIYSEFNLNLSIF